ncbi:MAG: hypothetical protein EOM83_06110 [Clostridia bacterium]|nr:hypothetical protein [Clostridia bacterium]
MGKKFACKWYLTNLCSQQLNRVMAKVIKKKNSNPKTADDTDELARFRKKKQIQNSALKKILEKLDQPDRAKS